MGHFPKDTRISSKDYYFLHPGAKFARILSTIMDMGIENLTLNNTKTIGKDDDK
ncbi:MAG: hypothetical protein WAM14_17410 [Candidatus Nitrosopolaris sp.]